MRKMASVLKKLLLAVFLLLGLLLSLFYYNDLSRKELWERYAYKDSQTAQLNGMPVHYRITGEGDPILLLHGTGASLHTWETWTEVLQDSLQVISVDLPAFGLTGPHPERDYSIDSYVRFVQDFTTMLGLDSFSLAGNSLGGLIAWSYTAAYPEKVTNLMLLDPSGFPKLQSSDSKEALPMRLAKNALAAKVITKITPRFIIKNSLLEVYADDAKVSQELVDRYFDMSLRAGNRQAFVDRTNTKRSIDTMLLTQIEQPTMILWGDQDQWIPEGDADRFSLLLPNDTVVILPNIGHVPMEEVPRKTANLVLRWLVDK